jgi:NAD(P)-binding Rossmann-like domain
VSRWPEELHVINRLFETAQPVEVQETTFSIDVTGRYVCSTWDEAVNNGGVAFDAVVIGAGMFGAYCAEKIYRRSNLRVLVLDAGSFLVSEHVQNLARVGLNAAGAIQVPSNSQDPGTRERVWGSPSVISFVRTTFRSIFPSDKRNANRSAPAGTSSRPRTTSVKFSSSRAFAPVAFRSWLVFSERL